MKIFMLLVWASVPVFFAAYHYGPGQEKLVLDDVDHKVQFAQQEADRENWPAAVKLYNEALVLVPKDRPHAGRKIRLERDRAMMFAGQLPEAYLDLEALLEELEQEAQPDPPLVAEVREAMANAQYYVTWTLRLEGAGKQDWEPIIEGSRQNYKLLAEQAQASGDSQQLKKQQESLEAVIRLAEIGQKQLQGIPLPKQCQCKGCCNGVCNKPGQGKKKSQGKGQKKKKDHRGASSGPPADNGGS